MPDNRDAVKHCEGMARESARPTDALNLRVGLKMAAATFRSMALQLPVDKRGEMFAVEKAYLDLANSPHDPDAVILNPDDEVQVEAVARAICLVSEGSEDRWFDYEPEAKAAILVLKEMKP